MRLSYVSVALAASFLIACEASSMTTDSNQISKVILTSNPSQRLLRTRYTAVEANADSEEKALTPEKMKKMMKKLMTKEEYAAKLEVREYRTYMDFLNDMAKTKKYAKLVMKIKAK
ncbi:hypothetical protein JG688_00016743 [Phytophthora aleatoria]|uniref:RxLR effector protein n=1 Tax=Phytophthora aleatoria TaxID=2496075 RepID=A0A8J5I409_9STRA|nr:hypothetical protein JG688_00016743 [Phytophthora aleatoria]